MSIDHCRRPSCALIVWSDYREMGARLPLLFHQAGITVDLLGADHRVLTLSRHIRRKFHCDRTDIPDVLKSHLSKSDNVYDWIVLGDEATLYALIDDPETDWANVLPVDASKVSPQLIISKALFTRACLENGIRMPPSIICLQREEIGRAAAELGYPVMVKTDRGCAGNGVRQVKSIDALPLMLQELNREHDQGPWIVQKFIQGRTGSTQLLMDHGKPVCWFASFKHTVNPPPYGPSCVRELFDHPEMLKSVTRIGKLTSFHGLCGVDWMVDEANTLYILEMNARPTPCSHLGPFAGVDFSLALRQISEGGLVTEQVPHPISKQTLIYLWPQYGYYCLRHGSLTGLLRFLPGVAKTDFLRGEPHILRYNISLFIRESARHFKHESIQRFRRRTQTV